MVWWMRRPVHVSWSIALTSAMCVVGVWAALYVSLPLWSGCAALPLVALGLRYSRVWSLPIGALAALIFGLGYGTAELGDRSVYTQLYGETMQIEGTVREDPSLTQSRQLSLQLVDLDSNHRQLPGALLATVPPTTPVLRGDRVTLRGSLDRGVGSYVGSMKRAEVHRVVTPTPGDVGRKVRDWFGAQVRTKIAEPQASLGLGFLTGQKSSLPTDLADALRVVGLTHIVVASGYNLTVLVRLSRRLLGRISKFVSALGAALMVVCFMAVTGVSPSMSRAGLVSGLSLLTGYYGRSFHPMVLLPFAAMVTVVIQPSYVWGDLGWQLSFAAFAGVMVVGPLLQRYFFGEKEPGIIRQLLGETIAAHAVTLPIIALSFGTVSHVAILANVCVVPFVPLAMALTFIVGIGVLVGIPGTELVAWAAEKLLGYMIWVAQSAAGWSWAQTDAAWPAWVWLVYAAGLLFACLWMWRATKYNFRDAPPLV